MAKVLVIDDEAAFREGVIETLQDLSFEATGAESLDAALPLLDQDNFSAIFIDNRMPGVGGVEGIKILKSKPRLASIPIVMITAFADEESTISAIRFGAFDHLSKPVGREDIRAVMQSVTKAFPAPAAEPSRPASTPAGGLIGSSPSMRELLKRIGRVAPTDSSVLITGETGTGKELVAKTIHANSLRARAPFIAVNCAAIPDNLLESELFGHTRGAFTGAVSDKLGSFQLAEGGTLFLDEIGDMNLSLQAKMLRAIQEREVTPVGSGRPVKVDIRLVAATHQNLQTLIAQKAFREDLYYRLNVVEISIPPLRERAGDLANLSDYFLKLQAQATGSPKQLSAAARAKLESHRWPGNVRELKNVLERAAILSPGALIEADQIHYVGENRTPPVPLPESLNLPQAVAALERALIERALNEAGGNRSEAARKLGIQRQLLYTKMRDYLI